MNGLVFQYISTDRVNATAAVNSNLLSLHTEKLRCRSLFIAFGRGGGEIKGYIRIIGGPYGLWFLGERKGKGISLHLQNIKTGLSKNECFFCSIYCQ